MPIIKILPHEEYCPTGAMLNSPVGNTICETLLENKIQIEHACDMSCACTTCHVIVHEGFSSLNALEETEEDLLDRYNRLFKSKNGIALVTVEHGVCAGCNMQVTHQTILEVRGEKGIIGCPQCGRILYEPQ